MNIIKRPLKSPAQKASTEHLKQRDFSIHKLTETKVLFVETEHVGDNKITISDFYNQNPIGISTKYFWQKEDKYDSKKYSLKCVYVQAFKYTLCQLINFGR